MLWLCRNFSFVALIAVGACTTPYKSPVVENPRGQPVQRFDGVRQITERGRARVVWVHGMCTHDGSWALARHNIFAAAMNSTATRVMSSPAATENDPQRVVFEHTIGGNKLEIRYLLWSPLVAQAKTALFYDAYPGDKPGGQFPYERATLNNRLKVDLLNDCLADAVIYTGKAGNAVRLWMRAEVCSAVGGDFRSPAHCELPPGADPTQTVFVAESLGSKVLFDAISAIRQNTSGISKARFEQRLDSLQLVFMAANQIPLLDLADSPVRRNKSLVRQTDGGDSTTFNLFRSLGQRRSIRLTGAPSAPLHVVAFTDPNDLLSYRLRPLENIEITNVIVSNDNTYFGLLERPDTAHCGYTWNPSVIAMIAQGYDGERPASIGVDAPHSCNPASKKTS